MNENGPDRKLQEMREAAGKKLQQIREEERALIQSRYSAKPMKRTITTTVDVSLLNLERGRFITIATDGNGCVEIVRRGDGTLQVCVDDETLKSGVHCFEDIYGLDPFKEATE